LLRKLKSKGHAEPIGSLVIDELSNDGWQSEARFVSAFVNSRVNRGWGPQRILHALRERGVAGDLLKNCLQHQDFEQRILDTYTRKYGNNTPATRKELAASTRFMAQRGYTQEQIRKLFKQLTQKPSGVRASHRTPAVLAAPRTSCVLVVPDVMSGIPPDQVRGRFFLNGGKLCVVGIPSDILMS
jgi:regulatory protein